jgi:hypothetical protein
MCPRNNKKNLNERKQKIRQEWMKKQAAVSKNKQAHTKAKRNALGLGELSFAVRLPFP